MNVKKGLCILGGIVAAIIVVGLFWMAGFYLFFQYGLAVYALAMYIPGLGITGYLYLGMKTRGWFLETLGFILALSLAMMATVDLLTYL